MTFATRTTAVYLPDYPVTYASYARTSKYGSYEEQDVLFVFSKNNHEEDKKPRNDIIGLSNLYLPTKGRKLANVFNNFYNVVDSHRISHFRDTKALIVR